MARESQQRRGVSLPIARELVEPTAQSAPSGVRLLVVDDEPRVRRLIATAMARAGFHVFAAEDGTPALGIAAQTPPDLAIVDFDMPTPGLEVVRRLKALHGAAIYIAMLSGQDDEQTRACCFDAGADDVIAKPIAMTELKRRMIAAARMQQAYVETRLAHDRTDRLLAYGAEAAAMLAHDLNNGLAIALGNISYVHGVVSLGDEEMQALEATMNALRRMSGLVANFVDIARFEDASVKPQSSRNNVRALIHEVIEVHATVPAQSVRFEIDCDPALVGNFDGALVERALHHLVGNSTRYVNPGGTIRISAHGWDPLEPHSVEVLVFNTGPTVPEALQHKLFAKYAKGSNGKRGFGLYFCRLACEAHGGLIEYRPSGAGSTFAFRLPGRN